MDSGITNQVYNNHNVYILGAGFSAEAGLPVVKDFMNVMRGSLEWLESRSGRQREIDAISSVLNFRLNAASAAYRVKLDVEDIEQLFSLAAASANRENLAENVSLAIAATLDCALDTGHKIKCRVSGKALEPLRSWNPLPNQFPVPYECPLHHFCLSLIAGARGISARARRQRDTIITFNYDTLVEDALHELGIRFSYGLDRSQATFDQSAICLNEYGDEDVLRILKIHGSVNWVANSTGGQPSIYGHYGDVRRQNRTPLLVPPTWQKGLAGCGKTPNGHEVLVPDVAIIGTGRRVR